MRQLRRPRRQRLKLERRRGERLQWALLRARAKQRSRSWVAYLDVFYGYFPFHRCSIVSMYGLSDNASGVSWLYAAEYTHMHLLSVLVLEYSI